MKTTTHYALTVVLILLFSQCGPSVTFTEPQPAKSNPLDKFPSLFLGQYKSLSDISILVISGETINEQYDLNARMPKDTLLRSGDYTLKNDTLINKKSGMKMVIFNDSVDITGHYASDIFSISDSNILKKSGDDCFLNVLCEKDRWAVEKISMHGDTLIIADIDNQADREKLEQIAHDSIDSQHNNISLNRRQFKRFVREGGFKEQRVYLRVSKS